MQWIRTFPEIDNLWATGRAYVIDSTPRVFMDRNYVPVLAGLVDDTVVLEWDVAASWEDRATFARHVAAAPQLVHVAPYRLYPASTGLLEPVWAHRTVDGAWIGDGAPSCDLFGLGMTYLPLGLVGRFLAASPEWADDTVFSSWHHRTIGRPVPVHWDVRPVHLHY